MILGGAGLPGPHLVEVAQARGHTLTLFNRGRSNPQRFDGTPLDDIEPLRGDRKDDLSALEGAAGTPCSTRPRICQAMSRAAPACWQAASITTRSSRRSRSMHATTSPMTRTARSHARGSGGARDQRRDLRRPRGGVRTRCADGTAGRTSVVRLGLIAGPAIPPTASPTGPHARTGAGEIAAPGAMTDPTQCIDVRDPAAFLLQLI